MQTFLGVEEGGRSGSMLFLNLISNLSEEEGWISKDRNSGTPEYHRKNQNRKKMQKKVGERARTRDL